MSKTRTIDPETQVSWLHTPDGEAIPSQPGESWILIQQGDDVIAIPGTVRLDGEGKYTFVPRA